MRPVILAVSGGIDSMAMLAVAGIARKAGRVGPFVVAHVDHGARPESALEGRVVADVAGQLGFGFVQLTPNSWTAESTGGPEAGLREMRYHALGKLAFALGIDRVVTAHTEDDQVETILMRLLSGSSSIANAGMKPRQLMVTPSAEIEILRPFLGISRSELEAVLDTLGLAHVEDRTNQDLRYQRNRLRARVVPELLKLDSGFSAGLIRAVEQARQDAEVVDDLAEKMYRDVAVRSDARIVLPVEVIACSARAISTRLVRMAILELVTGDAREVTYERVTAVVGAATRGIKATIEVPYGIVACIEDESVIVSSSRARDSSR